MIEVRNLVHRYGDATALEGVSLTVENDEFVVVAGANGSGKTTLVRHFNGLLEPDEGRVAVNGRDVHENLVAARTSVGMVFQNPRDQFVAATVGADVAFGPENLGLSRQEIDRRVADALDAVDMRGRGGERIDRLSGGERERVAIAGALAMEADHLVLDEPFTGLDEPATQSVRSRLATLSDDEMGIIVVTHDVENVLELADRLVVLQDGEIAVDGPPEEVDSAVAALGVRPPC